MKTYTKAELIDFRDRLVKARDWELALSGDKEGVTCVTEALERYNVPMSIDVVNFVSSWTTRSRKEIAALFANSIAYIERPIKEMK